MRLLLLTIVLATLTACSGSGPTMTGLPIGNMRVVKTGDIVTLTLPLNEDGSRRWRVTSYDSAYLAMPQRPRREGNALVLTGEARRVGESQIEITEIVPPGQTPKRKNFKLRVGS
jgi:hypothetical protein